MSAYPKWLRDAASKGGKQTPTPISEYLASIGSKGGKVSRRTPTTAQAQAMVKAREAKRSKKPKASARRANEKTL